MLAGGRANSRREACAERGNSTGRHCVWSGGQAGPGHPRPVGHCKDEELIASLFACKSHVGSETINRLLSWVLGALRELPSLAHPPSPALPPLNQLGRPRCQGVLVSSRQPILPFCLVEESLSHRADIGSPASPSIPWRLPPGGLSEEA